MNVIWSFECSFGQKCQELLSVLFHWDSVSNSIYIYIYGHIYTCVSTFWEWIEQNKEKYIGCESKHCFWKLFSLSSRPPQMMRKFLEISIAGRKCMCVSGKVALWPKHFDIRILVPMSYLKLWSYIYGPSRHHREATGGHGRPRETTESSSRAQSMVR